MNSNYLGEKQHGHVPTGWFRVIAPDGSVWFETRDKDEARRELRKGDRLYEHWEQLNEYWAPAYERKAGGPVESQPVVGE